MAKYSELASKLLQDAATFLDSVSEQNEPIREQMQENANVFRQIGLLIERDPGGYLDEMPLSELAAKLLNDAAKFFEALGENNAPLKDQMAENSTVFAQMAKLLESDPLGEMSTSSPKSQPGPRAKLAPPVPPQPAPSKMPPPDFTKPANAPPRAEKSASRPPDFSKPATPAQKPVEDGQRPHPSRNPLSVRNVRLNAHQNYIDPIFGLSFPTAAVPRPMTVKNSKSGARNKAVWGRDNSVCRYCGFRSEKYQAIVGPHDAVTNSQLHCACIMCAQVMALDEVPVMRSGVLIYLPEIGQAELHVFARLIYYCRISQGPAAAIARALLDHLMWRREGAREQFGTDDPFHLVARLRRCDTTSEYRALLEEAKDIRLFPLDRRIIKEANLEFNQFPQILAFWRSKNGPFGGLPPPQMDMKEFQSRIEAIFGPLAVDA